MNGKQIAKLWMIFALGSIVTATRAQENPKGPEAGQMDGMQMPSEAHHQHGEMKMPAIKAEFPRMRRAQENQETPPMTLEELQNIADERNPAMREAEAEIRAAKARQQQAGLYPNPTVGYTGDEIRGGSVGGGQQGFFVQQTIVTGGKLGLSGKVFGKEVKLAEMEAEEQKTRVKSAVQIAYLRVLAAQELLDARRDIAKIGQDHVETQRRLFNTGQADETELLDAQVEAQRTRMAARMQENSLREEWRSLAAVVGEPEMPVATVAGDLETGWPDLNEAQTVETVAKESPAARIADGATSRAQAVLARAKREPVPDIQLRAGLEYNHERLDLVPFAKGWEGLGEASIEIPVFNRNQGNISAARANVERAEQEKLRIALTLRERAAVVVDQYANARLMAEEYRDEMLPLAKKSYALMVEKYGEMLAAYPRVLDAQRKLYELQIEYIAALEEVWTNGVALQRFLLTDGLEAPARPGEVDLPIRETNMPMQERSMATGQTRP
jgi:cobalt-zinc-cadmium efflux system outer membrane protein